MVSGDTNSKLGGILAIVALMNADVCNTGTRISRFGNYLRNNCLSQERIFNMIIDYTLFETVFILVFEKDF